MSKVKKNSFKTKIVQIFRDLNIPANLKGYRYLKDAVEIIYNSEDFVRITVDIYPTLAKKYGITCGSVERAVRHTIEAAWNRCGLNNYKKYFGDAATKSIPTNSELINTIVEALRLEEQA